MSADEIAYTINKKSYLILSVLIIFTVRRIVAQAKPSGQIFLVKFCVRTCFDKVHVQCFSILRFSC